MVVITNNNKIQETINNINNAITNVEDSKTLIGLVCIPIVGQIVQFVKEKEIWKQIEDCPLDDLEKQIELRSKLIKIKQSSLIGNTVQALFFATIGMIAHPFLFTLPLFTILNAINGQKISECYEEIDTMKAKLKNREIQQIRSQDVQQFLGNISGMFQKPTSNFNVS